MLINIKTPELSNVIGNNDAILSELRAVVLTNNWS